MWAQLQEAPRRHFLQAVNLVYVFIYCRAARPFLRFSCSSDLLIIINFQKPASIYILKMRSFLLGSCALLGLLISVEGQELQTKIVQLTASGQIGVNLVDPPLLQRWLAQLVSIPVKLPVSLLRFPFYVSLVICVPSDTIVQLV